MEKPTSKISLEVVKSYENREVGSLMETVRIAVYHRGKFLVLQKNENSKNPLVFEFPGGKIDEMKGKESTYAERIKASFRELEEETKINAKELGMEFVESFETRFEVDNPETGKKHIKPGLVHLYLVRIPDEVELNVKINQTFDAQGKPEDNHRTFYFVEPEKLFDMATVLRKNPHTGEKMYQLARNSRHVGELLTRVGKKKL